MHEKEYTKPSNKEEPNTTPSDKESSEKPDTSEQTASQPDKVLTGRRLKKRPPTPFKDPNQGSISNNREIWTNKIIPKTPKPTGRN